MKKLLAGLVTAAMILTLTATNAFAAPRCGWAVDRICNGIQAGHMCGGVGFVDEDGDGICDYYDPEVCPGNGLGQGNGQGMGRGYGQGMGRGNGQGMGRGNGQGMGRGYGQGMGRGNGQGMGRGCHGGRCR